MFNDPAPVPFILVKNRMYRSKRLQLLFKRKKTLTGKVVFLIKLLYLIFGIYSRVQIIFLITHTHTKIKHPSVVRLKRQSPRVIFSLQCLGENNYFKELIYTIMGTGKFDICIAGQLDTQARADVAVLKPNTVQRQNSLLSWAPQSFLLRPSKVG